MASVAATAGVAAQHDGQHSKTRRLFCPTSKARRTKIYLFPKVRNYDLTKPARASQEGRFAIATTRGAGCDGRVGPQGVRHNAYGQAVWSWHPDAGAKPTDDAISALRPKRRSRKATEANKPGLRGERGAAVKPLRRECRAISALPDDLWAFSFSAHKA